jgi:sulfofructose kinase
VRPDGSAFGVEPYELEGFVDSSGAGDVFKAGIIFAWLQADWSLEQQVKFACAAAALNSKRDRTLDPLPNLAQVAGLMKSQPR